MLYDAVKIRLKANVPVGNYLSGELDSILIGSHIKQIDFEDANTYSIGLHDNANIVTNCQIEAVLFFTSHYINEILSEDTLKSNGIFNPTKVKILINISRMQKSVSEIDQMAIAGLLST